MGPTPCRAGWSPKLTVWATLTLWLAGTLPVVTMSHFYMVLTACVSYLCIRLLWIVFN